MYLVDPYCLSCYNTKPLGGNMTTARIKPLNPRSPDQKYMGEEPAWPHRETQSRQSAVMQAWHWYTYYYGKKEVKQFITAWLAHKGRQQEAKLFAKVPESALTNVTGWLCRMEMRGLELITAEIDHIEHEIQRHITAAKSVRDIVLTDPDTAHAVTARPTIQDRLRDRITEAAGELEGMFDDFVAADSRMSAQFRPMAVLRGMNVAPQMITEIVAIWQQRLSELTEAVAGRDSDLVEGYSNFSRPQLRNLIKFVEQVIADCNSYVQIKKVERKPRAKKARPPEVVARGFKTLTEDTELKLRSEPAARLVGASEAWLYDVKKRKLIHAVADSHVGTFTVKGSGLIGIDPAQTLQKTLRKPTEQLKSLMAASVPNARKFFRDIRATEIKWNGRGNENLVILRVK